MTSVWERARRRLPLGTRPTDAVELLDGDGLSMPEVDQNLADLARLNRLPGGTAASVEGVRRLLNNGTREARVLDVGTGRGDMPLAFAIRGWRALGLDVHPDVLAVARRETDDERLVEVAKGDGRALPFDDGAFDVVHASLLVHHFDPTEAVSLLREMRRVARYGIVVNDLRRGVLPLLATGVGLAALGRSRVTHYDGLLSARRAYTLAELDALLAEAGLGVRWRSSRWLPRVVTAAAGGA